MAAITPAKTAKLTLNANDVVARAKVFWSGLAPRQRLFLGVGLGIALIASVVFVKLITSPDYKPLMTGLQPEDAQGIGTQLAASKIPYTISPDGTMVSVPANKLDQARLEVASHDSPHSGRIGYEIFDKTSWGQTEFDEKVNYQRALEGELERTIQTLHNVKSARVHLVMPTDSIFSDEQRGAKASVTLRLKSGTLSRTEAAQITRLVAGAVDELDPSDVVVIDADSNRPVGSGDSDDGSDGAEQELSRRLMATLAPVVGADAIRATVNVEYENRSSEQNDEKYDPNVSVPLSMQRSQEGGAAAGAGGVPGTSSNIKAKTSAAAAANAAGPMSTSESATYGVNKSVRHEIDPAGGIRRITAAIVLDDAPLRTWQKDHWVTTRRRRTPDELKTISDLAQAAIGFNATRGDVVSVQNLGFDRPEDEDAGPETIMDRVRKQLEGFSAYIRYGVLLILFLLVYLLMVRPFQKKVLATPIPAPLPPRPPMPQMEAPVVEASASASVTHRSLELKKELTEFVRAEPETSTAAVRAWMQEG